MNLTQVMLCGFHVTFVISGTMQNAPMYLLMIIAVSAPWTGTVERV